MIIESTRYGGKKVNDDNEERGFAAMKVDWSDETYSFGAYLCGDSSGG